MQLRATKDTFEINFSFCAPNIEPYVIVKFNITNKTIK